MINQVVSFQKLKKSFMYRGVKKRVTQKYLAIPFDALAGVNWNPISQILVGFHCEKSLAHRMRYSALTLVEQSLCGEVGEGHELLDRPYGSMISPSAAWI